MKRAPVIARRELFSYFYSPVAYAVMFLFLVVTGYLFLEDLQPGKVAGMRSVFERMVWLLVFAVPMLTMGLMAQEWSSGTIETMMTAPVDETDVIIGKFLGSLGFFVVLLLPTLLYVIVMAINSTPRFDVGPIISGYLGMFLVGAMFISIGLFCSSMTRSQIVAAVVSAAILAVITLVPMFASERAGLPAFWRNLSNAMVFRRYTDFSRGVIDTSHFVFFIAVTAVFLFLSTKVLESRRWK